VTRKGDKKATNGMLENKPWLGFMLYKSVSKDMEYWFFAGINHQTSGNYPYERWNCGISWGYKTWWNQLHGYGNPLLFPSTHDLHVWWIFHVHIYVGLLVLSPRSLFGQWPRRMDQTIGYTGIIWFTDIGMSWGCSRAMMKTTHNNKNGIYAGKHKAKNT
jgi:hypothetical protein